ncbi:cell division protein SepF [bacterium]|nr:cell division protein SepF [bacterium]
MARMLDSLKRFFTMEEDSFAADGFDSESEEREAQRPGGLRTAGQAATAPAQAPTQGQPGLARGGQRPNLVGLPSPRKQEIVVLEPASFADAREIAESLKVKKCILLNMRKTDKELARRIVDFLSGISYAMEGNSQKVADNIFLFVPGHMEIVIADHQDHSPKQEELIASGDGA